MTNEVNALLAQMGGYPNEVASTFLYRKGKLIKTIEKQGHGNTVSQNLTDLIADAVEAKADAVIFAHNHPSGTSKPSAEDEIAAMQKRDIFEGHDIEVLGNYIVTAAGLFEY